MLIRIFYACSNPLFYGGESGIRSGVFDPYHAKAKKCSYAFFYACSNPLIMAERVGFEPTNGINRYTISSRAPSTRLGHLSINIISVYLSKTPVKEPVIPQPIFH